MKFEDFIKEGKARKTSKDIQLFKSIINTSEQDLKFLDTLKITENSARKLMISYYDTLRSFLEAIVILKGYKIYFHEAYTYFLKQENENLLSEKFDRFRKIRNDINYYGKNISIAEMVENKQKIIEIIKELKQKFNLNV
ncbi:MAG: hypothetical protein AABX99_01820, partial [Nanoarchaeota archaeon]